MEAMRAAVEGVSSGLLSTAEPGAPPVVIATEEFSISAKLVSEITEVVPCVQGKADANNKRARASTNRVCKDTTNPVIKLSGSATYQCNSKYTDPGYKSTDTAAPFDLTKSVRITIKPLLFAGKIMKAGKYAVAYTVADDSGNRATATRQLNVVDTTPPAITMNGDAEVGVTHSG